MLAGAINKKLIHPDRNEMTWHDRMTDLQHDIELARRIAAKEESALHELYSVYGQRLYAYACRLAGDPALAEDVVQDTLVAVWRSANRYRGQGRLLAWLLSIVHHTALKALRKRSIPILDEMEDDFSAADPSLIDQVQASEQARWVQAGLDSLPPEQRAVLDLVFYQGMSLNETARICGCPVGTVKSRLNHARQRLRGVLIRTEESQ